MKKDRFDDYIRRFNRRDTTAFDEFLAPDMHMKNGTLEFVGVDGMKNHYAKIWSTFAEVLRVDRFVSDDNSAAIIMHTDFLAERDDPESMFGDVTKGETFAFDGVIMYAIEQEKFADILVAYNSFVHTDRHGVSRDLGIPH